MKNEDYPAQLSRICARIIGETLRSGGTRTLLHDVVNDLISAWGINGGIRARVAGPAR